MNKLKLGVCLMTLLFAGCSAHYSNGYRAGVVRKFSNKGVFIKSWEGELLLGGVVSSGGKSPTLVNEIFEFSVDSDLPQDQQKVIADKINAALDSGKRVKLYYNQNTYPKIRTETDYFIENVVETEQ